MERAPRVLGIDDGPENLLLLRTILREAGIAFIEASDAEEGYRQAVSERPDLILLDVMMPGKDGFALCRELKENPAIRAIPVIFVTALSDRASIVRGLEAGGVDYIPKPFDPAETLARVRTHLRLKRETEARVRYQEAASASRRRAMLGDLLGGLAHNFNNLLLAISGNLSLALQGRLTPQEHHARIDRALDASRRLAEIVARVTSYLRREAEAPGGRGEDFPLVEEIRAVTDLFASSLPRRIRFAFRAEASKVQARGAPEALRESLAGLLQNALEAIPSGGDGEITVTVTAEEGTDGPFARIEVRDTGKGMDEETLASAAIPFFSTKHTVGVGLGLTVAESFAAQQGGRLELVSRPGEGTRAALVLPVRVASPCPTP